MLFASPTKISLSLAVGLLVLSGCSQKSPNSGANANISTHTHTQVPERYQVRYGDTVSGIASRYGLNWREVSAINRLDSNHAIRVGQWLTLKGASRVVPRVPYAKPTQSKSPYYPPAAKEVPKETQTARKVDVPANTKTSNAQVSVAQSASPASVQTAKPAQSSAFVYPASPSNAVVRRFGSPLNNNAKTEGIFLSGRAGDVVLASRTGVAKVVKMDSGERTMIVLEHDGGYRTTYLDVHQITIRTGQTIRVGDRLGVMAAQTTSGVALFEFRVAKDGQYIDPLTVVTPPN